MSFIVLRENPFLTFFHSLPSLEGEERGGLPPLVGYQRYAAGSGVAFSQIESLNFNTCLIWNLIGCVPPRDGCTLGRNLKECWEANLSVFEGEE